MYRVVLGVLIFFSTMSWADSYDELYQAAGWQTQFVHFRELLTHQQQKYKQQLPKVIYQMLLTQSNQRFDPQVMNDRALATLRTKLANPEPSLTFFRSALGKKVVSLEEEATSQESVKKNSQGIALMKMSSVRKALIDRLVSAVPYEQVAVDGGVALLGLAKQVLSGAMQGFDLDMLTGKSSTALTNQIRQQVHPNVHNTVAFVYRSLSDQELTSFVTFAESADGQAYYQAVSKVIQAALQDNAI